MHTSLVLTIYIYIRFSIRSFHSTSERWTETRPVLYVL